MHKLEEWLVVDAVSPNWSPWAKFPANRENNREFIEFRPYGRKSRSKTFNKSAICAENYLELKQGINSADQRTNFAEWPRNREKPCGSRWRSEFEVGAAQG